MVIDIILGRAGRACSLSSLMIFFIIAPHSHDGFELVQPGVAVKDEVVELSQVRLME